jgi:hypothetical protein
MVSTVTMTKGRFISLKLILNIILESAFLLIVLLLHKCATQQDDLISNMDWLIIFFI